MTKKICDLPGCNQPARRRFCCNKHKDRYHNLNNPRGKFAHLSPGGRLNDPDDDPSWDAHKDSF